MKKQDHKRIEFKLTDFDQPFTNGLCCPLATAIKRHIKCKEVNVAIETVIIDNSVYKILPPFTYDMCQHISYLFRHKAERVVFLSKIE